MDITHETRDEQKARWNGPAGRAWVDAQESLDRLFKPFEELLVDAVSAELLSESLDAPLDILDVGCGTGGTTLAVARRLGATGRLVGVDISDLMVAAARARVERESAAVRFICGDAQVHAFEPAVFDRIISRFGVMFFDDPVRAFANLRRAAKHDARLRLIVWRSAEDNPFMTTAERAAAPLLPNLPARRPDAPGQFAFANRERVHRILQESGWTGIDIRPIDVDCTLPERELTGYLTRLGPVGLILQEVDDKTRAQVVETVRRAFDPYVSGAEVRFRAACWFVAAQAAASFSFPQQ
jgi:SAM-dependent methyltransferase